jgi:RHS repeat-associated protein
MDIPGRQYNATGGYRFGFNGKEKDNKDGVVQYDYGFRIYDPRLVRFKSVDPLSNSYPFYTPYQFAGNSPLANIDLDGLEQWAVNPSTGEVVSGPLYMPNYSAKKGWVSGSYNISKPAPPIPQPQTQKGPVLQIAAESTSIGKVELQKRIAMAKTVPKPVVQMQVTTVSPDNRNEYEKQVSADYARQAELTKKLQNATMDPLGGGIIINTALAGSEYVKQTVSHGVGIVEGVKEGDGLKIAGNTLGLAMDLAPLMSLKGGASSETFYRAMSEADFAIMQKTGKIPATSETFISPAAAYSSKFDGVLVEINTKAGTLEQLKGIGVRDASQPMTQGLGLPNISPGWKASNAFFKQEAGQINIGLGQGKALETFNNNIQSFKAIKKQ